MNLELMTVNETAEYLRLKPITIYKWLIKQKFKFAFKLGNRWRIDKGGLNEWLLNSNQ